MPADTVKVDRSTPFGNPFSSEDIERSEAVALFRAWLSGQLTIDEMSKTLSCQTLRTLLARRTRILGGLRSLRGKNLACWCPLPHEGEPDNCHASVLLELANREVETNASQKAEARTPPRGAPDALPRADQTGRERRAPG